MCVCACVCPCVRARARARVCVCTLAWSIGPLSARLTAPSAGSSFRMRRRGRAGACAPHATTTWSDNALGRVGVGVGCVVLVRQRRPDMYSTWLGRCPPGSSRWLWWRGRRCKASGWGNEFSPCGRGPGSIMAFRVPLVIQRYTVTVNTFPSSFDSQRGFTFLRNQRLRTQKVWRSPQNGLKSPLRRKPGVSVRLARELSAQARRASWRPPDLRAFALYSRPLAKRPDVGAFEAPPGPGAAFFPPPKAGTVAGATALPQASKIET